MWWFERIRKDSKRIEKIHKDSFNFLKEFHKIHLHIIYTIYIRIDYLRKTNSNRTDGKCNLESQHKKKQNVLIHSICLKRNKHFECGHRNIRKWWTIKPFIFVWNNSCNEIRISLLQNASQPPMSSYQQIWMRKSQIK